MTLVTVKKKKKTKWPHPTQKWDEHGSIHQSLCVKSTHAVSEIKFSLNTVWDTGFEVCLSIYIRWSLGWLAIGGGSALWGAGRNWGCRLTRLWYLRDKGCAHECRQRRQTPPTFGLIWLSADCTLAFSVSGGWTRIVGKSPAASGVQPVSCPRCWEGLAALELPEVGLGVGSVPFPTTRNTQIHKERWWLAWGEGWVKQDREIANLGGKRKSRKVCGEFKFPEAILGREPWERWRGGVLV